MIGFGSTWNAFDAFKANSTRVPNNQKDAEDRQFAAEDQMFEQLDGAFAFPNAIQFS